MKDELPDRPKPVECGIINLENSYQNGSHWTCYFKKSEKEKYYFDSYGNASPPKELVKYLENKNIRYNSEQIQKYNDPPICGHLSLIVLKELSNGKDYETVLKTCRGKLNSLVLV